MRKVLRALGHVTREGVIALKGRAACELNTADELVVGELLMEGVFQDLDAAVVAIGENFEATVLTTLNLLDLGLPRVIVRANDANQERILSSLGVTEILSPESEVAEVVSERLINPNIRGFLSLPDDYEIAELKAPAACHGRQLADLDLANRYELRLITIRREFEELSEDGAPCVREHILGVPKPDTTIEATDTLVVFGSLDSVKRFLDINT